MKKKRKKRDHSLNEVSLSSSLSASDLSHCEGTVAHANGLSGLSKRKRRHSDRDKASAGDTSGPTSTSGAKREKHQDDKGNEKEECKNEEGGHNSIFLETSAAAEHDTKSYRKKHNKYFELKKLVGRRGAPELELLAVVIVLFAPILHESLTNSNFVTNTI